MQTSSTSSFLSLQTLDTPQRTLKQKVTYEGIGIHTGHNVKMTFVPAEKGTGILFKRLDLPNHPEVPARAEYVVDTSRSTTIGLAGVLIHTVEHVLAALYAYGIDNLIVELNAPEPPVGNGSSDVFVEMIEKVGIKDFSAMQSELVVERPIYYSSNESGKYLVALPYDSYKMSYTLHYPKVPTIGTQYHSLDIHAESFKEELSSCRTFALYSELKMLMDAGLIRGGSLENAVVIHDDAIFSSGGLKFPNEMARHKILDMIGDLSLIGFRIRAHIISICSGHETNVAFAKKLLNPITAESTEWNHK